MNTTAVSTSSPGYYLSSETLNIVLSCVSGFLSAMGTLFIIITFFIWKDIQTSSRRILLFISISDLIAAVGNIVALLSPPDKTVCLVQSIIGTFFILCSFFWTVFLAIYLFVGCTRKKIALAEQLMSVFHVIGWGVPCIIVCTGAFTNKFGNNGDVVSSGWCWIDTHDLSRKEQVEWMLIAGKFWEVSAFIAITILYILIKRGMRHDFKLSKAENLELSYRSSRAAQTAERKLILVPLSFVLLRIWGTVRFFIYVIHEKSDIKWLIVMQGIGDNAPGFFNFLIFCFFTEKVLSKIRMFFSNCCYKLCPGMVVYMKTKTKKYDNLNSGICEPVGSNSMPDYQTFEKSSDELCESCTTN